MRKELELAGEWELKPVERFDGNYDSGKWTGQEIPGHWQELLEFQNYSGRMVYRKKFSFPLEKGRRYWLKLNGVFYWCAAYLNGCRVGVNPGYFIPACFEITDAVKSGGNEILLEVFCFAEENLRKKKQILGVWHHWDCLDHAWNPGGIWQSVEIFSSGPIAIFDPMFHTLYLHPEYARIAGRAGFDSLPREEVKFKIKLIPENHQGASFEKDWTVFKDAGEKEYPYWFDLKDYRLWWSWDQGEQNLYRLRLEVRRKGEAEASDIYETLFGVRTFQLRDYLADLNGRRIWLKGNNYAPGDYRIRKMTGERYQKDLELAREANLNILRVHAHIEKPEFYQQADRRGILLWQDFALQWAYDKKIMPEAVFQAEEMIKTLYHHPSIILWCLHNEPVNMYDTRKRPGALDLLRLGRSVFFYSWNREVMDKELEKKARFLDPSRPVFPSAGERGLFRKDAGDAHLYFGWYFGPLHYLNRLVRKRPHRLKLVDEFGSQSFPNYESAIKFMPDRLEKLNWEELEKKYLAQPQYLNRYIPQEKNQNLKGYIQATQDYQSLVNRYYIDRLRYLKYRPCGGALAFDFIDPNPCISWSVVDYWRVPKSSYYELKKAFSPVYAFALINLPKYKLDQKLAIPIFAVNDLNQKIEAKLSARIISPMQEVLYHQDFQIILEPDAPALALANPMVDLRWPGEYQLQLKLSWHNQNSENNYSFRAE